ncbi:hypothetical protein B0O80DRAFT_40447 [Mortierella sp. GBAus27b]|nr:hypothetical protein B0O80DRAFT_40447 [Mortierella sp. GBAus27b]
MHNTTGVYGVNLQGVKVGTWQGNLNKISIPDSYGLNDSPNSPSTSPTSSESAGGGSKAGIIGGVCAALVVVVGAILFVFYRRKRRQLQKDDGKDGSPTNPTPVPTHQGGGDNLILGKINVDMASNSPMKLETVPSYQDLYPQQHPPQPTSYLTYPNSTPSTSQAPANGMYTSAGQYNPTPFNPGFSNLPATNAGYEGQPAPTFWEPKPFVPPPRNNNTSGQGSSS